MNKLTMNPKSLLLLFLLAVATVTVQAQEDTRAMGLKNVIDLAALQSRDALSARHRFRSSFWEYRSYRAQFLPSLRLNTTLPSLRRTIIPYTTEQGTNIYIDQSIASYSAQMSLSKTLGFSGGQLYVRSGLERIDNLSDSITTSFLSNPVLIGFNQPILAFNPYRWAKKIEPLKYEEAQRRYLEDLEQVSISAINYFFDLLQSEISMKIAETNEANYDTLYKIAQGRYNLGKIAENELLQLELSYLRARAEVENARLDMQMNSSRLKSFLHLPDEVNIRLLSPTEELKFTVDVKKALAEAHGNRSDIYEFQRQLFEAESQVQQARLENRFNANLYAEYGLTRSAPEFKDVYNDPQEGQLLSFGIQIPILDWGEAKGKIRMAQSNRELIKNSVEQQQIDFDQEIFLKVMQFNMQERQLAIAAKADTVAQKRYFVTKQRYLIGKIDITDLNIAQTETDNARLTYISALRTFWRSYYELRKLTLFDFREGRQLSFDFNSVSW